MKRKPMLECERRVRMYDGPDMQGHKIYFHERCQRGPAKRVRIKGVLTSAMAVLCEKHTIEAVRENYTSKRGYDLRHKPLRPKKNDSGLLFRK